MARYTYHYSVETGAEPFRITCGSFAQMVTRRYRDTIPAIPAAAYETSSSDDAPDAAPAGVADDAPDAALADPAALHDASLWAAVTRLRWALRSDRKITDYDVARFIADARADGEFEGVLRALRTLAASLVADYPVLAGEARDVVLQLVALGSEMANAAAQSPDLFLYVKNELQPVHLAALLNI